MGCAEYLKDMLRPLRLYELDSGYGSDELETLGGVMDGVTESLDETEREMLVPTALSTGLLRLEELFPFAPSSLTTEGRRAAICALLAIDGRSFTCGALNSTLAGCGISAEVSESDAAFTVSVRFPENRGVPENIDELKPRIEKILPCHLAVEYVYIYVSWDELEGALPTWAALDAARLPWRELEALGG